MIGMEHDLKLFKELLMRLPYSVVNDVMSRGHPLKSNQIETEITKALQKQMDNYNITVKGIIWDDDYDCMDSFIVVIDTCAIRMDVNAEQRYQDICMFIDNKSQISIRISNDHGVMHLYCPDAVCKHFPLLEKLTGIYISDKHRANISKMHSRTIQLVSRIYKDYYNQPVYYWKQSAYTLLAIYTFHKDSLVAKLPKDVLKMIIKFIMT